MALDQYLPQLREIFIERILPTIKGKDYLTNDKNLKFLFGKLYDTMPFPIRALVSQDKFAEFCLKQKKYLFPAKSSTKSTDTKATAKSATSKTKSVSSATVKKTASKESNPIKVAPKKVVAKTPVKKSSATKSATKVPPKSTKK